MPTSVRLNSDFFIFIYYLYIFVYISLSSISGSIKREEKRSFVFTRDKRSHLQFYTWPDFFPSRLCIVFIRTESLSLRISFVYISWKKQPANIYFRLLIDTAQSTEWWFFAVSLFHTIPSRSRRTKATHAYFLFDFYSNEVSLRRCDVTPRKLSLVSLHLGGAIRRTVSI